MRTSVDVGAERCSLFANLDLSREAEDLKAAAVRENRARPPRKAMKTSRGPDHIETGPQHEVIRVGEDNLCSGTGHFVRM
jgi:hypothetical protein